VNDLLNSDTSATAMIRGSNPALAAKTHHCRSLQLSVTAPKLCPTVPTEAVTDTAIRDDLTVITPQVILRPVFDEQFPDDES
jgi:hypothetical protein